MITEAISNPRTLPKAPHLGNKPEPPLLQVFLIFMWAYNLPRSSECQVFFPRYAFPAQKQASILDFAPPALTCRPAFAIITLIYYEGTNKYVSTPELGMASNSLVSDKGYLTKINVEEGANFSMAGVGGTIPQESYKWNNLWFRNASGNLKNVTDAINDGWILTNIGQPSDYICYFDGGSLETVCGSGACTDDTLYPWRGYYIWSNYNNIQILRRN